MTTPLFHPIAATFSLTCAIAFGPACALPEQAPDGGCLYDEDCSSGEICWANSCTHLCNTDSDCPDGQVCGLGQCFPGEVDGGDGGDEPPSGDTSTTDTDDTTMPGDPSDPGDIVRSDRGTTVLEADGELSELGPVTVCPNGDAPYRVTLRDTEGTLMPAEQVELAFAPVTFDHMGWCEGTVAPDADGVRVFSAITDEVGVATFYIAAGGCLDPTITATSLGTADIVRVYGAGVLLGTRGVTSADVLDQAGLHAWESDYSVGELATVGIGDLAFHTPHVSNGTYHYCSDFDGSGVVHLPDALFLTTHNDHACVAQQ